MNVHNSFNNGEFAVDCINRLLQCIYFLFGNLKQSLTIKFQFRFVGSQMDGRQTAVTGR